MQDSTAVLSVPAAILDPLEPAENTAVSTDRQGSMPLPCLKGSRPPGLHAYLQIFCFPLEMVGKIHAKQCPKARKEQTEQTSGCEQRSKEGT